MLRTSSASCHGTMVRCCLPGHSQLFLGSEMRLKTEFRMGWVSFCGIRCCPCHVSAFIATAPGSLAHGMQNLDLYLINEGKAWYLTDAGGFNSWLDPHADRIVQAVGKAIPAGQSLTYVIREFPFGKPHKPAGICLS